MWFDLTLEARDGARHTLRYNPHTSECEGLPLPVEPGAFDPVPRVSKDQPLGKSRAPRVLKIQLGLSCNYACSYCNQAFQIADATVSKLADVEHFLTQLDGWIAQAPERIEIWGGEPFLYWAKIKRLVPALAERFLGVLFSIITNGSLLNREKLDFIAAHDIAITITHDGPGQHLRGPDPLDDPDKREWIETLLAERADKVGFNAVLTREHHDLQALKAWFADNVGPDIFVGLEGVVNVYDAATALGIPRTTFYRSYDLYVDGGLDGLADRSPRPGSVWNRIPDARRDNLVEFALEHEALTKRKLAVKYTDERRYFISKSSAYRILKAADLITAPDYVVIKAADEFTDKTTAINEMLLSGM